MKTPTVKISISGGVAYLNRKPAHVAVEIYDHDNADGLEDGSRYEPDFHPATRKNTRANAALLHAAGCVLANWQTGDLAAAVRKLSSAVDKVVLS